MTIVVLLALFQQCLAILPFASWFVYFFFPGDLLGLCSLDIENNAETHGFSRIEAEKCFYALLKEVDKE